MPSSFKNVDLFGSGPHRFVEGPCGQDVVPRLRLGMNQSGSVSIGTAELSVTVTGRLIAADDADLAALVDAIKTQLAQWSTPGKLVSQQAYEWSTINFVRFTPGDRIDRGREVSMAYTALFIKL